MTKGKYYYFSRARSPLGSSSVEYRRPERSVQWGTGGVRIHTPMLEPLADNSNRRQFGMGVVGRFFRYALIINYFVNSDFVFCTETICIYHTSKYFETDR